MPKVRRVGSISIVVVGLVVLGVARSILAEPARASDPPAIVTSFEPPRRFPEITTHPDAPCRPEGECLEGEIARSCTDAGRAEDEHCLILGMHCARDRCGPGPQCCMIPWGERD